LARGFAGRFISRISQYTFIYGDADQGAKFQFSFDLPPWPPSSPARETITINDCSAGLYATDTLGQSTAPSSPFYDTSYMPEFAVNVDAPMPKDPNQFFTWLGWRAGVQHESNGKDGPDSRSLNTVYLRHAICVGEGPRVGSDLPAGSFCLRDRTSATIVT